MEALKQISELALADKKLRHPNMPEFALVKPKYKDNTSNELTKSILAYFRLNGGYAVRINTQGQYNESLGMFTKSTTKKGTADIHGVLDGIHHSVEIKIGRDTQSDDQIETQEQVEAAGGRYFIARNFQEFYDWITNKRKELNYAS